MRYFKNDLVTIKHSRIKDHIGQTGLVQSVCGDDLVVIVNGVPCKFTTENVELIRQPNPSDYNKEKLPDNPQFIGFDNGASATYALHPCADAASRIAQGLLASPICSTIQSKEPRYIAKLSVKYLEAVLSELEKSNLISFPIIKYEQNI